MVARSSLVALVLAAATPAVASRTAAIHIGDAAATQAITRVRIAAAIGDAPASDAPAYARETERVTLYAVIEVGRAVYSDAPALRLGGKRVTPLPLSAAPRAELAWQRIEPTSANLSNGDGPTFHYETIEYRATPITATSGTLVADVRPTLIPDYGHGLGTMRFQLIATQGARTIASPGSEARRGAGSGGLSDAVTRVSVRKDDTVLGYMTEMFNQPYIWASAGRTTRTHQSERLEGSDCADLMVYGARRAGAKLEYTWTGGLPSVTTLRGSGTRASDGVYRTAKGVPVAFTRPGDLVLFPRHVGALVEDRGTIGVLDDQDLMLHTLFDAPKIEPIASSGYADKPLEVRRWR